jgi:purine nucleoside phosphorylase
MSSIPELTLCHFFRLPVVGVSVITNECFSSGPVSHAEVLAASLAAAGPLGTALRGLLAAWRPEQTDPPPASV